MPVLELHRMVGGEPADRAHRTAPDGGVLLRLEGARRYTVGRAEDNDLILREDSVSSHHAYLEAGPEGWRVVDLGSTNGVWVNGRAATDGPIVPGDRLVFGAVELQVVGPEPRDGGQGKPSPGWSEARAPAAPAGRDPLPRAVMAGSGAVLFLLGLLFGWLLEPKPGTILGLPRAHEAPPWLAPPVVAGYREILAAVPPRRAVYRFDRNQRILVFDFPTLRDQGLMLNRLAALVEKAGLPKQRVIGEAELARHLAETGQSADTFYFGHDYAVSDIARFFNLLDRDGRRPTDAERVLRDVLVQAGALIAAPGGWAAAEPPSAVISLARSGADGEGAVPVTVTAEMRETILRHELSHGEFFTNPIYRDYVLRFWKTVLSDDQRQGFRRFLEANGYDPTDEALMANEVQAYLVHTVSRAAFRPERVGLTQAGVDVLRARFLEEDPSWLADAFPFEGRITPVPAAGDP